MTATDSIGVLTWNVRGYNSETSSLRDEIVKQNPHVVILQGKMTWIENDEVLNCAGAKCLIMTAIQQFKGKRGGLAIIFNPEVEFTGLYRHTVGVDFDALKNTTIELEHTQIFNLSNAEEGLPDAPIDVGRSLSLEA